MAYHISLMTLDGVHISETMCTHMPASANAAAKLAVPEDERVIVVASSSERGTAPAFAYVETRKGKGKDAIVRKYHMSISTDTPR